MTPEQFWQNFKLGQEQEIAANFIYDGLRILHDIDLLGQETEIFPVLYNLSIGLERLSKVLIILNEFEDDVDVTKFEKKLKTHEHLKLFDRVKKATSTNFNDIQIEFLGLLSEFYNNNRYDRLTFSSLTTFSKDKKSFLDFLHKNLNININEESSISCVENSFEIKYFIGKIVKDIVDVLYDAIRESAHKKNLYTYEISSSSSKAGKVLIGDRSITFEDEDRAIVEAIIFFMKTKESSLGKFLNEIDSLPLDPALDSEYLQSILRKRPQDIQSLMDEIESYYDDIKNVDERLEIIDIIKNKDISI